MANMHRAEREDFSSFPAVDAYQNGMIHAADGAFPTFNKSELRVVIRTKQVALQLKSSEIRERCLPVE